MFCSGCPWKSTVWLGSNACPCLATKRWGLSWCGSRAMHCTATALLTGSVPCVASNGSRSWGRKGMESPRGPGHGSSAKLCFRAVGLCVSSWLWQLRHGVVRGSTGGQWKSLLFVAVQRTGCPRQPGIEEALQALGWQRCGATERVGRQGLGREGNGSLAQVWCGTPCLGKARLGSKVMSRHGYRGLGGGEVAAVERHDLGTEERLD
jgi:hypothetical protein